MFVDVNFAPETLDPAPNSPTLSPQMCPLVMSFSAMTQDNMTDFTRKNGSSGWIRTSNPPVNSNQGAWAPSLDTETCGQVDLMRS
jgi:hypothetical protein